jgi:hypothetical protein
LDAVQSAEKGVAVFKKLLWLLVPVAAVGVPPLVFHGGSWWAQAKQRIAPLLSLQGGPAAPASVPAPAPPGGPAANPPASADPSATPTFAWTEDRASPVDLADAIRFDVTPSWVMARWPWVSAGLSQLQLQGYRVPLVTGTATDDLAGSLTYYFNARQQCARITFQGTTGDAGKLLRLLIGRYRFGRRLTNDPGLFRYEVPVTTGEVQSYLDLRLILPKDPYRRFAASLVIERPE